MNVDGIKLIKTQEIHPFISILDEGALRVPFYGVDTTNMPILYI